MAANKSILTPLKLGIHLQPARTALTYPLPSAHPAWAVGGGYRTSISYYISASRRSAEPPATPFFSAIARPLSIPLADAVHSWGAQRKSVGKLRADRRRCSAIPCAVSAVASPRRPRRALGSSVGGALDGRTGAQPGCPAPAPAPKPGFQSSRTNAQRNSARQRDVLGGPRCVDFRPPFCYAGPTAKVGFSG